MCGFVAIYKKSSTPISAETLEDMTNTLVHRGPDDYGFAFLEPGRCTFWKDEHPPDPMSGAGVAMGHRRLSILDLSHAGRQPFTSKDRQLWMVYNGEIFNYLEIRSELEGCGCTFETSTDTEVVLAAYSQWGSECFRRFNGMWALVIWDRRSNRLVASRDRFGIKPLYYCQVGADWYFASEIKALLRHPDIEPAPDSSSVFRFLFNGAMPDPGSTLFTGIHEAIPGECMTLERGAISRNRYWSLPDRRARQQVNAEAAADKLFHLLSDAVKLRMRSDVRVGTMLSGGLDSTSVISMIRGLADSDQDARRVIGDQFHAFNAGFPGLPIDESENVREVTDMLGLEAHVVFPMEQSGVQELFETANYHMEAPFHNSVPMVHSLLMQKARSVDVKVILNGHGADELFAGYPADYSFLALYDMVIRLKWIEAYRHINGYHRHYGLGRKRILYRAFNRGLPDGNRLSPNYRPDPIYPAELVNVHVHDSGKMPLTGRLDRQLRDDFSCKILPRWLSMEDKISMAASIEARLPFLDYRIVEFAFTLDNLLKINSGTTKDVLRKAMYDRLPRKVVQDRRKFRFSGPEKHWLTGAFRETLMESFIKNTPLVSQYLDARLLRERISRYISNTSTDIRDLQIWRIFNTEMWLRKYF